VAAPLTPEEFQRLTNVSRETLARLARHLELVRAWQKRINLVGARSLDDAWRRHVLDSAQLLDHLPPGARTVLDIGSGAGFPGLVLALLGVPDVHLVESDRRKAAFLREAARQTGTQVTIHAERVEALAPFPVDVVTARACAPLSRLLELAEPFLQLRRRPACEPARAGPGPVCLFPKGRTADEELTAAGKTWKMRVDRLPSRTAPEATLLLVKDVEHR
jgi:16S rRNA (guanine527-N7)-methyltransferase